MPDSIFTFVLKYSYKKQIYITFITLISFPILYISLELPKIIINHGVKSHITADLGHLTSFLGFELDKIEYLLTLSFLFLLAILVTGMIKMYINTYKGLLGETMLRKFRFILFHRLLRFPSTHFKTLPSGQIIPMITAETEPLGGFIGDAFALPIFQGGTLLIYILFIFIQNPILGISAISLYPVQAFIIPKLQRKINLLAKDRVLKARFLASNISDTIDSINEIHLDATERLHLASFTNKITEICTIRYQIYKQKFFMKFLNNFLNQLTPFFFYSIGGYAAIKGQVSIGALVAVIAAYKDLASPWKELLNFYQQKENIKIKYCQIISNFTGKGLLDESVFKSIDASPLKTLQEKVKFNHVTLKDESEQLLLNNISFEIDLTKKTSITGNSKSGKEYIGKLIARLCFPSQGSITIRNSDFNKLPFAFTSQRISYLSKENIILNTSIYNNITHAILDSADIKDIDEEKIYNEDNIKQYLNLYKKGSNINYSSAGVNDEKELQHKIINLAKELGFEDDLYKFGLQELPSLASSQYLVERILTSRKAVDEEIKKAAYKNLVKRYHRDEFNEYANIIENLIFGTPSLKNYSFEEIYSHPYFIQTLKKTGLYEDLLDIGIKLAMLIVDKFENTSDDHILFNKFDFVTPELIIEYKKIIQIYEGIGKKKKKSINNFNTKNKKKLLQFSFPLTPAKHPINLINAPLQEKILETRRLFINNLPKSLMNNIEFFNVETLNKKISIAENILFGKIVLAKADTQEKINHLIRKITDKYNFTEDIMALGLKHQCGPRGVFITTEQSQKIKIIKALIKNSDVFVFNEALNSFDAEDKKKIQQIILRNTAQKGVIWIDEKAPSKDFNTYIHMCNGVISS